MTLLLVLALSTPVARAGLWSWCVRTLVAEDPYQFEGVDRDWLLREQARLQIRVRWSKATAADRTKLEIIDRELSARDLVKGCSCPR